MPLLANQLKIAVSSVAPRLSELETKAYRTPLSNNRVNHPEPTRLA